jgi:hypothetical protein
MDFACTSTKGWIMRRWIFLAMLLLAGCQSTVGPLENHQRERPDQPYYSIPQQERLGRDRYSYPDDSFSTGPKTGVDTYGPTGR